MKRLGRAFVRLVLLVTLIGAAAAIWIHPVPPPPTLPPLAGPIDLILIEKTARRLTLIDDGKPVRSYQIALGFSPKGDKERQGDGRTPEGRFTINRRNDASAFHLSLGLDYPQKADIIRARAGGYDPGGDIMIHGQPNSMPKGFKAKGDWTAGCIALTNAEIGEVWAVTPIGTPVEIRP